MARLVVCRILTGVLIALVGLLFSLTADAAKKAPSSAACDFGNVLYDNVSNSGAGLTSSIGCTLFGHTNDNAKNDIPDLDPFGIDDWILADISDGGGNGIIDLTINFSDKKDYLGT